MGCPCLRQRSPLLRFSLEPSHLWAFIWGIGVGIIVAIVCSALYSASHSSSSNTNHLEKLTPTPETDSKEGFRNDSNSLYPFEID